MQRQKDFGMTVYVGEKGIDEAIRRFRKRVEKSGILDEVKEHQTYKKPSEIKNTQNQLNKRRRK